jgi:hypothetical protein
MNRPTTKLKAGPFIHETFATFASEENRNRALGKEGALQYM